MMKIFLHFSFQVPCTKKKRKNLSFVGGRNILCHVKFDCLCSCFCLLELFALKIRMRLWKWKITHIDELYHQTNISCSLLLLLLISCHSIHPFELVNCVEGFLFLPFCSSTRKMKKRSRVKTLFLISIVNFSRHPRFWVFFFCSVSLDFMKIFSSRGRNKWMDGWMMKQ